MFSSRALIQWHRRFGLLAALPLLLLLLTGLLLNHSAELDLQQRHVHSAWLEKYYGMPSPSVGVAFNTGDGWVSQWQEQVYVDARPLTNLQGQVLTGASRFNDVWLLFTRTQMMLFLPDGTLIDELEFPQGDVAIRAGTSVTGPVVELSPGSRWSLNSDLTAWKLSDPDQGITWLAAEALPASLQYDIERLHAGGGIDLERLMLDLHSGRFFGRYGVFIMDAAALFMLFLLGSGTISYVRRMSRRTR